MLSPQDFDTWRNHLRSFIPERPAGGAQRIYVSSSGGTELKSVDLSPIFTSTDGVTKLAAEVQNRVQDMKAKGLAQPSLFSSLFGEWV